MKKELTLVIGSSGTVGSEIVRLLMENNQLVRLATSKSVQVHDSASKVHINLETGEGVQTAFSGVDRAFLLSPPGYANQFAILSPLISAAKNQKLKKVVLMTALGANANPDSPLRKTEIELENSGLNYNIIRPNWFYQNFNTFWLHSIIEQNKILLPAGDAKVGFIDARDISMVATKLLLTDKYLNKEFDITGPVSINHNEIAAAISDVAGKKISYEEIQPDVFKNGLVSAGLPAEYADMLVMIFGFLRDGFNATVNANVELITGQKPRGIKQYTNDYKQFWINSNTKL